jgi:hypothetical protein
MSRAASRGVIASKTRSVDRLAELGRILRSDIWNRYMAAAQRKALIWWRDRTVPPGLAARFTNAGADYYKFGRRLRKPSSLRPFYMVNGDLMRAMAARKPRTRQASKNGGVVSTQLKFGGGALNFMTTTGKPDMRPVTGWTRTTRAVTESFNVGSYTRATKAGGSVTVQSYSMTRVRTVSKSKPVRSGETHAALFGKFTRDAPAIQARVQVELRRILRRTAFDKRTGMLKSGLLEAA